MHATLDALRRGDRLAKAGDVEKPLYLPTDDNDLIRRRSFLRVPLTGASTPGPGGSATVWLVQVNHINVGGNAKKKGPSYLGSNPLHKKIRLCAAAQNLGQAAAAAASTRGASSTQASFGVGLPHLWPSPQAESTTSANPRHCSKGLS